ncbi:ADP-heptose--LPS heptosyltransferase 2 [Planctomycetes bacterium Pla163]|uniref:ADP-heptose--LPS heptosyltransferase 2 n=1 Tax=Rohdeia mirabilis TaxID=2528008 RepID=A0A518D433_9BACT|nr:ADP-heptose--LPS heptosyltransferase 2 [Planctomycetes bacterium Pla163]
MVPAKRYRVDLVSSRSDSAGLPARVLVVRLGAIGDVVNALVFATALKRARPDTHVGWAIHDLALPLVEGHPSVDRVHLWRRGSGGAGRRAVTRELRAERYDLAVDLQRIAKSALLARASGAPRVLGYDRRRAKEFSWLLATERIAPGPPHEHMVDQYLAFARHLGCDGPAEHLLPVDAEADAWAAALVDELGAAPVLINPGASKPRNRWSPECFGALAKRLVEDGAAPVVAIGGPGDRELATALLAAAGPGVRDLVGATTLPRLIALERRARLVVTGDTGPMHLAVAVGTPTLALFGPADPRRTGPYGSTERTDSRHTVLRATEGRMDALAVETVHAAARAKLANERA